MDIVRVSNTVNPSDGAGVSQHQQQQPQQTPSSVQHSKTKDNNSNSTRNGLNQQHQQQQQQQSTNNPSNQQFSSTSTPKQSPSSGGGGGSQLAALGSTVSSSGGSFGGSDGLHQTSSDSGNSSCVSGSAATDDPETKNASFASSSGTSDQVTDATQVIAGGGDDDEDEDVGGGGGEKESLLKGGNIYVNKIYDGGHERENDEGIECDRLKKLATLDARGSSTETDENAEDVKPLLKVNVESEKRKPKSIVKSPSNLSFGKELNGGVQRPRLNLQFQLPVETVIDDRPAVHHVQFSKQENGYCCRGSGAEQDLSNGNSNNNNNDSSKQQICSSPVGSILSQESGSGSSTSSSSNENSSLGGYAEARPPDGGWGWVVCFASFMVNLIADGVTFSFGVLYVELLNYFGEGKGKTAWVGSLFMAMPLLSGPIASFLTDRYGCRNVTIVGSILASAGFALSAYAETIEMLYLTFGVLAGFGLSLCYVAAVVIVAYYFDKKRSFATGLSVCGSGIGTCIFAKVTQILLDEYGWRGTTLILAGIFLNMCLCGLLMRDLEWTTHKSKLKRKQKEADSYSVSNSTNTAGTTSNLNAVDVAAAGGGLGGGANENAQPGAKGEQMVDPNDPRLFSSLITLPTFIKNGEKLPYEVLELLYKQRNVHEHVLQNYPNLLHSRSFSEPLAPKSNDLSPEKAVDPDQEVVSPTSQERRKCDLPPGDDVEHNHHPFLRRTHSHRSTGLRTPTTAYLKDLRMHRHSLTYRGAMLNIQRYRLRASSCPDIYRNSMTTIAKEKTAWYQGIDEFKTLLVSILDLSYFRDVRFLLFALSNFLLYTWYDVPYVYLTDNATEMGFTPSQASMLISIIGIVNMVGEIVLGWMGDRKSVNANFTYAVCMGLCGLVTALVPLFTDYTALSILAGAFGLFIAANYSLTSIILVELITLEKFTNAYGLLLLVQGVANLVGPPLAGWISDLMESYNLSFYLAGLFIALSGLLLLILPAIGEYKKYNQRRVSKEKGGGFDGYGMNNLTLTTAGTKANGAAVLLTADCFAKEKLIKEGACV